MDWTLPHSASVGSELDITYSLPMMLNGEAGYIRINITSPIFPAIVGQYRYELRVSGEWYHNRGGSGLDIYVMPTAKSKNTKLHDVCKSLAAQIKAALLGAYPDIKALLLAMQSECKARFTAVLTTLDLEIHTYFGTGAIVLSRYPYRFEEHIDSLHTLDKCLEYARVHIHGGRNAHEAASD